MSEVFPEISVILPCRNEEAAIGRCLDKVQQVIDQYNLSAEIIVSDSSTDRSADIASQYRGVLVVKHNKLGYGNACRQGFAAARGRYVLLIDADDTYDFEAIPKFLRALSLGYEFVIGNRFTGRMESGAMPVLNKYIGNPVLSWLVRVIFSTDIRDVHCGMRACPRSTLVMMGLRSTGMEFASEMVIKAVMGDFRIAQIPIAYYHRTGHSKLQPLTDGLRHFLLILLYSPFLSFILKRLVVIKRQDV